MATGGRDPNDPPFIDLTESDLTPGEDPDFLEDQMLVAGILGLQIEAP